jgi:hypothetical protein
MLDILFLNHKKSQCGVYNYGIRLYNIWKKSLKINFVYKEINSLDEYNHISFDKYNIILYNYHVCTMEWLTRDNITIKSINIGILHECYPQIFDYCINTQSDIPRPIFELIPTVKVTTNSTIIDFLDYGIDTNIPIIGSFGFGFTNKGFDKIVKYVNDYYDTAIIKIIMPFADFGDKNGEKSKYVSTLCSRTNTKPNIEIKIIHDFLEDDDILYFLSKNTINMFLYDKMDGRGISSTIDFAISVNTPLCISDSYMFRHIYNDNICIYKTRISNCINNGTEYIDKFKEKYSHNNSIQYIENYIKTINLK